MAKLAKDVGVKTFKTYNEGNNLYYVDGTKMEYASDGPLGAVPPDPQRRGRRRDRDPEARRHGEGDAARRALDRARTPRRSTA